MSEAGCTVIVGARDEKLGKEACDKLAAAGAKVEYLHVDLLKPETIEKAASTIDKNHGRLDILVNNAGIIEKGDGSPGATSVDSVENTLKTNFIGPLRVTQLLLPLLKSSRGIHRQRIQRTRLSCYERR